MERYDVGVQATPVMPLTVDRLICHPAALSVGFRQNILSLVCDSVKEGCVCFGVSQGLATSPREAERRARNERHRRVLVREVYGVQSRSTRTGRRLKQAHGRNRDRH